MLSFTDVIANPFPLFLEVLNKVIFLLFFFKLFNMSGELSVDESSIIKISSILFIFNNFLY